MEVEVAINGNPNKILKTLEWGYHWNNENGWWTANPVPPAAYAYSARPELGGGSIDVYYPNDIGLPAW
jgi:hypothetical protein